MSGSGYGSKAAIKRPAEVSLYGTEATSITNQIPLLTEGMAKKPNLVVTEAVVGHASVKDIQLVGIDPSGPINTELWFEGLEYLLFALLGFESPDMFAIRTPTLVDQGGSPAPDTGSPSSFLHIFEADVNIHREKWLAGERAVSGAGDYVWTAADQKVRTVSYCHDKGLGSPSVEHFVDCMVNRMTMKGAPGKAISLSWDLIPRSSSFVGSSAAWALPSYDSPRPAFFPQLKFYASVPASTLTFELPIAEFELIVDNGLKGDDYDTGGNDASAGLSYRTEPVRQKPRKTSLRLKFNRFKAATANVTDWFDQGLDIQARLTITGPAIAGSAYPFAFDVALPHCKVIDAKFPVAGPGIITGSAELMAQTPPSAIFGSGGYSWIKEVYGGVNQTKKSEIIVGLTNTRGSCFSRDRNAAYPLP